MVYLVFSFLRCNICAYPRPDLPVCIVGQPAHEQVKQMGVGVW